METHTDALAQIYAKSLFELAQEAGGRDKIIEVGEELGQIGDLVGGDEAIAEFLASPIISTARRRESLLRIFADKVTDLTLRFLLVLNAKGRLGHFGPISRAYGEMVQEALGRIDIDLHTPAPLGDEQAETIRRRIGEALRLEPILHRYTDESMIGGLKLRIGDQLIDGSIASRLRRLREELLRSDIAREPDELRQFLEEGGAS